MDLALFDLDNTLLAGDSDFEWGQFLIAQGLVNADEHRAQNEAFYQDYQTGTLDIERFLRFQLHVLTRHPRAQLEAWRETFISKHIDPLITTAAQDLVQQHRAQGALCAIVTATNSFVTWPIARRFNIPHLIATIPAQKNGQFTGQVRGTPAFRAGKVERVQDWLETLGLHWSSFEHRYFYSDSHNDLPLLDAVDIPIAVDPDPQLRAHAEQHGWRITSLR